MADRYEGVDADEMLDEVIRYAGIVRTNMLNVGREPPAYLLAFIDRSVDGSRGAPSRAIARGARDAERAKYQVLPDGSIVVDTAEQAIAIARHFSTGAPIASPTAPSAPCRSEPIAAAPARAPIVPAPAVPDRSSMTTTPAAPAPVTSPPTPDRTPIEKPMATPPASKPTMAGVRAFAQTTDRLAEAKARRQQDADAIFAAVMSGRRTRTEILKQAKDLSKTRYHHALNDLLESKRVARLSAGKFAKIVPWVQRHTHPLRARAADTKATPQSAPIASTSSTSDHDVDLDDGAERVRAAIAGGCTRSTDIMIKTGGSRPWVQGHLRILIDRGIVGRAGSTNQTRYWIANTPQPTTKALSENVDVPDDAVLGPELVAVRAAIASGCTTTLSIVERFGTSKATVLRRIAVLIEMGIVARGGTTLSPTYSIVDRKSVARDAPITPPIKPIAETEDASEPVAPRADGDEVATLEDDEAPADVDTDDDEEPIAGSGDLDDDHAPIATIGDGETDDEEPIAGGDVEGAAPIADDVVLGLDGAPVDEDEDDDEEPAPAAALSDHEVRVRADCAIIAAAIGRGFTTRATILKACGGMSSSRYFQALGRLTKEGSVRRDGSGSSARLSLVQKPDEIAVSGIDRAPIEKPTAETESVVVDDGSDPIVTAILAGHHTFDKILAATGMARGVASYRLKALVKDKKIKRTDNGSNPRYYVERPKGSLAPLPPRAPVAPAAVPRSAPKIDVQENEDAEAEVDDDGPIAGPKGLDEDEDDETPKPKSKGGRPRLYADLHTEALSAEVMHFEIRRRDGTVIRKAANVVMGKQIAQRHEEAQTLVRSADGVVMWRR